MTKQYHDWMSDEIDELNARLSQYESMLSEAAKQLEIGARGADKYQLSMRIRSLLRKNKK